MDTRTQLKVPGNEMIILLQVFVGDSITINRDIKKITVQMTSFVLVDSSVSSMNRFAPVTWHFLFMGLEYIDYTNDVIHKHIFKVFCPSS